MPTNTSQPQSPINPPITGAEALDHSAAVLEHSAMVMTGTLSSLKMVADILYIMAGPRGPHTHEDYAKLEKAVTDFRNDITWAMVENDVTHTKITENLKRKRDMLDELTPGLKVDPNG